MKCGLSGIPGGAERLVVSLFEQRINVGVNFKKKKEKKVEDTHFCFENIFGEAWLKGP